MRATGSAFSSTRSSSARRRTAGSRWASTALASDPGLDNIRDVITFPKTQATQDLMMGAPGTVTEKMLKELHIRVVE